MNSNQKPIQGLNGKAASWPWKPALFTWLGSWLVLALLLIVPLTEVRERIRQQLAFQRALTMQAVTESRLQDDFTDEIEVIMEASKLEGVLGLRLYDPRGEFVEAFPPSVEISDHLQPGPLDNLKQNIPVTDFLNSPNWQTFFIDSVQGENASRPALPLLLVYIPIFNPIESEISWIAEFIIEGVSIQREYQTLDAQFRSQILTLLIGGAILLALIIGAAYHRNYQTTRRLLDRTRDLLRANHELTLSAKMSAVGSITAHLFHGIKNPVQGLQSFVRKKSSAPQQQTSDTEWLLATQTVDRLQQQINNVVQILQETDGKIQYEIQVSELVSILTQKLERRNETIQIRIQNQLPQDLKLDNHPANIILLILENLLNNALDAARHEVCLEINSIDGQLLFYIQDDGPGIPISIRDRLFTPVSSAKKNGNGIGLSLCRQLAIHLHAELKLQSSDETGTLFVFQIPVTKLQNQVPSAKVI